MAIPLDINCVNRRKGLDMKRYLLIVTASFILGIIAEELLRLPVLAWLALTGLALLFDLFLRHQRSGPKLIIIFLCTALLGAFWYSLSNLPGTLFRELAGKEAEGYGYVLSYPRQNAYSRTFIVKAEGLAADGLSIQGIDKLLIKIDWLPEAGALYPGDRISFRGTLALPKGPTNPGQFDYRRYLANQQVFYEISCRTGDFAVLSHGTGLRTLVARGRSQVAGLLAELLPEEERALIMGLLFGDTSGIASRDMSAYQQVGVSHLFAVSGFNITYVLGILWFFLMLWRPSPAVRLALAVPVLLGYYFLVGWSASIVRACLMAFMALAALALGRKNDIYSALAGAALVILLINPGELFQAGFQLSFLTTLGMAYLTPWLVKKGLGKTLAPALAAQLTCLPLIAYYFNTVSLLAPFLNIIAALVSSIATVLGLAAVLLAWIVPVLAKPVFIVCGFLMYCLRQFIIPWADLPWSTAVVKTPSLFLILLYYLILAVLPVYPYYRYRLEFLYQRRKIFFAAVLGIAILIMCWPARPLLEVTFLDVGHGDSIFIKTPAGCRILIDGGGTPESDFAVGEKIVLPYLRKQGINRLDAVIMSHNHADHSEGLLELLTLVRTAVFYQPPSEAGNEAEESIKEICRERGIARTELTAGQVIKIEENLTLKVLHPLPGDGTAGNDHSLVLRLVYGDCEWLFTGDIEKDGLEQLLKRQPLLQADVLKLPHHGSISSYDEAFYQAVRPQAVIVSSGSRYTNHPHPRIREYFLQRKIPLYATKERGAVITRSDGKTISIRTILP